MTIEIKPIRQIAKPGVNFPGRSSSDGKYIYIPVTTSGVSAITKYDYSGNLVWERNLSNGGVSATTAVVDDGSILVASSSYGTSGKSSVLARYNSNGDMLWEVLSGQPTFNDIVVNGNTVYVGGGTGTGFNSANTAFISAYSLATGALIWNKTYPNSGAAVINDLEIADGAIYAAADLYGKQDFGLGIVGRLDLNGNETWWKSAPVGDWASVGSILVAGNQIIGAGYKADGADRADNRLISFNRDNGSIQWDKSWGDSNSQGITSIEMHNSKIYVSYGDGVPWNSNAINGGFTAIDELDLSGNIINTYKFDVPSEFDAGYSLVKAGSSLYMIGSTTGTISGQSSGGDYDVYMASVILNPKPVIRGNSLYTIVDGPSWTQAEANSVKVGGHLTSITSSEENKWIYTSIAAAQARALWIGGTDRTTEGTWTWTDGSEWNYSNWETPQPDNSNNEDYAQYVPDWNMGRWNDITDLYPDGQNKTSVGIAKTPFIRRGDSAYAIVQGPTWEEAEANAVKLGGHLVTISDAAENEWIRARYSSTNSSIWIGFNDKAKEGAWVWSSGDSVGFTAWNTGEPDGQSIYKSTENAAHLVLTGGLAGKWQDIPNNSSLVGLAEVILAPNNAPTGTPSIIGTLITGSRLTIDTSAIKDTDNFTGYTPTYKYAWETSTDGTTWSKLTTTDANDNNTTYTLTTAEVGKQIRGVVSYLDGYGTTEVLYSSSSSPVEALPVIALAVTPASVKEDGSANLIYTFTRTGATTSALTVNYTIGGTATLGTDYTGIASTPTTKNVTFASGSPFATVTVDPTADSTMEADETVALTLAAGTGYSIDTTAAVTGSISNDDAVKTRGNSLYTIVNGPTWDDAELNALNVGGHLVTINNIDENRFVADIARDNSAGFIGLYDPQGNDHWQWSSGAPLSFVNWSPERRNYIGIERWANINYEGLGGPYNPDLAGYWDTHQSGPGMYNSSGIVEIPFVRNGDSAYVIVRGPSWSEAEANAVSLGGHLVTIDNMAENEWVVNTFDPLVAGNVWIGFSDRFSEGDWKWSSGNQGVFTNWHIGEPNNSGNEDYAALGLTKGDGKWNDWGGSGLYGIAEIPLTPNSLPQGALTTSGVAKVGSTLVVDASSLNDADNITGYMPILQYTWEVSSNETTWTQLTTNDAIDNNSTYTLTQADTGKRIRAVVRYIDGHGTLESVVSSARPVEDDRRYRLSTASGHILQQDPATGALRHLGSDSRLTQITWGSNTPLTVSSFPGWQILGASQIDGQNSLLWRYLPTGQLHTWSLDNNWKQISGSKLYQSDSQDALKLERQFQQDLNSDGAIGGTTTVIYRRGSTSLLKHSGSLQLMASAVTGESKPLLWGGKTILSNDSRLTGWVALSAADIDGVNTVLWHHKESSLAATWSFDSNWNAVSGTEPVSTQSFSSYSLEKTFGVDLNNDKLLGSPYSSIATDGVTTLYRTKREGTLSVGTGTDLPLSLRWGGTLLVDNDPRLVGWKAVAAVNTGGVNRLIWKYTQTGDLATWAFDSQWNAVSGTTPVSASSPDSWIYEQWSLKDLNNDGLIGVPPSGMISWDGSLSLHRLGGSSLFVFSPETSFKALTWGAVSLSDSDPRLVGWSAIAATSIKGVNTLLWRYSATGQLATWSFDKNWNATNGTIPVSSDSQAAFDLEVAFKLDANKDGVIGSPYKLISTIGDVALMSESFSNRIVISIDGQSPISPQWGGSSLSASDVRLAGWTPEAAATIDNVNTLLWRHSTGIFATWTFDSRWNVLSGTSPVEAGSEAVIGYESRFNRDLNDDSVIGEPSSPLNALRYRINAAKPFANAKDPFTTFLTGSDGSDSILSPDTGNAFLSGSDLLTGQPLKAGLVDVLDGGNGTGNNTFLLTHHTNKPFAEDGDAGYVLVKNYDPLKDDLVLASFTPMTGEVRSLSFEGSTVTGYGLHLDNNGDGVYDSGDNLIALIADVTVVPSRFIRISPL